MYSWLLVGLAWQIASDHYSSRPGTNAWWWSSSAASGDSWVLDLLIPQWKGMIILGFFLQGIRNRTGFKVCSRMLDPKRWIYCTNCLRILILAEYLKKWTSLQSKICRRQQYWSRTSGYFITIRIPYNTWSLTRFWFSRGGQTWLRIYDSYNMKLRITVFIHFE